MRWLELADSDLLDKDLTKDILEQEVCLDLRLRSLASRTELLLNSEEPRLGSLQPRRHTGE